MDMVENSTVRDGGTRVDEDFSFHFVNSTNTTIVLLKSVDKFQSKLSPEGDVVFGLILVFTGLLSIIGNGGSLAVFYYRRRQLSPAETFLVNLGVVDILLSVASYPCAMISSFHHQWLFGSTGCTLYAFTCYFLGVASLASLTAIAVIRYLKTCCPTIGNRISCSTSWKIIVWVYIYAFFWAFLPLIQFGSYEVEPFGLSCTLNWSDRSTVSQVYIVLVSIFCVFIPFGVVIFCYSQIVLLVRKSDMLMGEKRLRRQNISDVQLTWMSCCITIGFIVGWLPYTVVSLWGAFSDEMLIPMWATPIPVLMAKSSIACNPFIYIFLTRRYRRDFHDIFSSIVSFLRSCKRNSESNAFNTNYTASPSNMNFSTYNVTTCEDQSSHLMQNKEKNQQAYMTLLQHFNVKNSTNRTTAISGNLSTVESINYLSSNSTTPMPKGTSVNLVDKEVRAASNPISSSVCSN